MGNCCFPLATRQGLSHPNSNLESLNCTRGPSISLMDPGSGEKAAHLAAPLKHQAPCLQKTFLGLGVLTRLSPTVRGPSVCKNCGSLDLWHPKPGGLDLWMLRARKMVRIDSMQISRARDLIRVVCLSVLSRDRRDHEIQSKRRRSGGAVVAKRRERWGRRAHATARASAVCVCVCWGVSKRRERPCLVWRYTHTLEYARARLECVRAETV